LATQIGSRLTGVMYVLDEPSIGLHQRDNARLLETLRELSDLGNTLVVVEHDEDTLRQADWLCDLGPGAGLEGGVVVANGPPDEVMATEGSVTADYLAGRRRIEVPAERTKAKRGKRLRIKGAAHNNLRSVDVDLPLGLFTAVTGVSGSGKSSLVSGILAPALQRHLHGSDALPGRHAGLEGLEHVDKAIIIDQSPIGRTPRSNPATYTKVFDEIRSLFAQTPLSKERGYTAGTFSFNVKGGRCEACRGGGSIKLEMNFLPDVWITCDICDGKRYTRECLEVTWKGKTIHDVLQMPVGEAVEFFAKHRKIHRTLSTLSSVGLDYIRLGQPATTLSGGEAQRVKLASELRRPPNKHTVYILDEPTTGLSFSDVQKLVDVLLELRAKGHTVVVIEHHLDVVKCADHVIDLGPEGGGRGGTVVATGTPEEVAANEASHTGRFLATMLAQR
jgi:excinuclease ABC subunit A